MNVRKTLLLKEVIEADNVGKACSPITRVVAMAVFQNRPTSTPDTATG